MSYTINRIIKDADFEGVDQRARQALTDHGFGILTEIDVKATMKKKLDKDMSAYRILGACNPGMALEAIGVEPRVGAMLPCNVILREVSEGIEVSAVDPVLPCPPLIMKTSSRWPGKSGICFLKSFRRSDCLNTKRNLLSTRSHKNLPAYLSREFLYLLAQIPQNRKGR